MSKILKDSEMIDIIRRAPEEIDCGDSYLHFLEDLGTLIADHFGGDFMRAEFVPTGSLGYIGVFNVNDCVPDDGGIYKNYDKDVTWKDGKETD